MVGLAALALGGSVASAQNGFWNFETPHVSPLALTPSGQTLLAVNTADNRLEVFTIDAMGTPRRERSIPVGVDPVSVRARSETEAWVVNHVSDSISIVDLSSGRVVLTLSTGDEPADVVFAGTPERAFVSVSQLNQVRVFDPANLAAAPVIIPILGEEPRALAVSPDGQRVYAAIFESGNATGAIRQQDVSNGAGPYAGQNPPPNNGTVFDPPRTPGLPVSPPVAQIVRRDSAGRWRDDNTRDWTQFVTWNVLDHDVAIINAGTLGVSYADSLMTTVMGIGVRADGTVTVVGTEASNELRFEPNVKGIFIRTQIGSFDAATPAAKTIADLNPHLNYSTPTVSSTVRAQSVGDPRGIVWNPGTQRAYVAGMGSNTVIVTNSVGTRFGQIEVGEGPTGLALSPGGANLYVLNKFDGTISHISTASDAEVARVSFFDPTPDAVKNGRPFLYSTRTTSGLGQVACASCHIDAKTDFLAWDLGDPSGQMKQFNQDCRQPVCSDWHPMKGPMVTQTLQGIVGNGPMHWRGDRENVAAFAPAYVGLQGAEASPSAQQMQLLTTFIGSIRHQPSPNRNLDGSMPASVTVTNGTGNPNAGMTIYNTLPVLPGGATCNSCHTLPTGTSQEIDDPRLPLAPQPLKTVHLRAMWEKNGWRRNSQTNTKGFGFNHHSEFDTLAALLGVGFNFAPGTQGQQQRRDVEAFMLVFDTETHAAVGAQVTFDSTNNTNTNDMARLNTLVNLASQNRIGLIAKGRQNNVDRGWYFTTGTSMQSDRSAFVTTTTNLRLGASAGNEITFTAVAIGTQRRAGADRDSDGFLDRDELDVGSLPDDAGSTPGQCVVTCDVNFDGGADTTDVIELADAIASGVTVNFGTCLDFNQDGGADTSDVVELADAIASGSCP